MANIVRFGGGGGGSEQSSGNYTVTGNGSASTGYSNPVDIGAGKKVCYYLWAVELTNATCTITLQGSNDSSAWTNIDSASVTGANRGNGKHGSTTGYRYYRTSLYTPNYAVLGGYHFTW